MKTKQKTNNNCQHKFGKWSVIDDEPGLVGGYIIQERICEKCNFKEINKQEY